MAYFALLAYFYSSSREIGTHTPEGHEGMLFAGLLPMSCSTCFLIVSKTTSGGVEPSLIDWALQHHH